MVSRPLIRVPVPPGPEGPARLAPALVAALSGAGPAIAPVPTTSPTVSNDYVARLLSGLHLDDGLPLEDDDVAMVVSTSGSTGQPRGVLLTAAQLTALTPVFQPEGSAPAWILALPVTSMGGINVLIRSLASTRELVVLPSIAGAGPFRPADVAAAVHAARATTDDVRISLVPAQLARLLADDAGVEALRQCSSILIGGAALRPSLRTIAEQSEITVTTTYGATETAGGCVLDGRPLPGVTVTVDAGLGDEQTTGDPATGRLTISGPMVALGYRGEPALSDDVLADGSFHTSDIGRIEPDGSVVVLGRADEIVIIDGINVSPTSVEHVLNDQPDIAAAAVVVVADAAGEPRLHAFLEPRENPSGLEDTARNAVARELGRAARPVIHRVARLPHLPHGKVDRHILRQWATDLPGDA